MTRKRHPLLLCRFRVYVDRTKKGPYYRVLVFKTLETMQESYAASERVRGVTRSRKLRFWAITSWTATYYLRLRNGYRRWRKSKCCGTILFWKDSVTSGVVSHEMTHAAIFHAEAVGWLPFDPRITLKGASGLQAHGKEEKLCWLQGWLVCQFWRSWYARRLE